MENQSRRVLSLSEDRRTAQVIAKGLTTPPKIMRNDEWSGAAHIHNDITAHVQPLIGIPACVTAGRKKLKTYSPKPT
jgi:hypothetical protein